MRRRRKRSIWTLICVAWVSNSGMAGRGRDFDPAHSLLMQLTARGLFGGPLLLSGSKQAPLT